MVLNQAWMSTGYQCFILIGQIYLISIVSELFQNQYNMEIILMKLSSCNGNGLLKIHEHVTSGTQNVKNYFGEMYQLISSLHP